MAFIFFPTINVGAEELKAWSGRINYNFEMGRYGALDIDYNVYYLESSRRGFTVGSMGPDGERRTADDITVERRFGR